MTRATTRKGVECLRKYRHELIGRPRLTEPHLNADLQIHRCGFASQNRRSVLRTNFDACQEVLWGIYWLRIANYPLLNADLQMERGNFCT